MPRRSIIAAKRGKKTFGKKISKQMCRAKVSRRELFCAIASDSGAKVRRAMARVRGRHVSMNARESRNSSRGTHPRNRPLLHESRVGDLSN